MKRSHRMMALAAAGLLAMTTATEARAQIFGSPYQFGRPTRGTYGPGMSFGSFGMAMNRGYAYGNPYGGLGGVGYGFGYGVGPGYGPNGSIIYNSAYNTPGSGSGMQGFYPPFAAYGPWNNQNPAIFGPMAPNWGGPRPIRYYYTPPGRGPVYYRYYPR